MPTVPQYNPETRRTEALPTPLVNPGIASADAFGAPIAEGANAGLRAGFAGQERRDRIAEQEREKVVKTRASDAYLKLSEASGKLASQSKLKTGSNARGLPDQFNAEYQKLVRDTAKELNDDPESLEVFNSMAERRRVAEVEDIQRHSDFQLKKYERDTGLALQNQVQQDALNGIISIDEALALQDGNRTTMSENDGLPQVEHDRLWQQDKDKTIGDFIAQQQQEGDFEGAQKTLDTYAESLSPNLRAEINKDLSKAKESVKAQAYAAAIMQNPGQTRAQAYQQLKMIDNPELRERTRVNVEREFAQREAIKEDAQASTYEEFADAIEQGESYDSLIAKNPLASGLLTEGQTSALRRVEQNTINRREPEEWGPKYTEARNTWSQFPEEFAKIDLRTYKGQVTKAEFDDLNERQQLTKASLTKATTKTPEVQRGFQTINEVVKSTLRDIGINPNVEDGEIDPRATRFTMLMDKAVEAAGGAAAVTNEQVRKIADQLLLEVEVPDPASFTGKALRYGTFGAAGFAGIGVDGTKKVRTFEMPNADRTAFSAAQIPDSDRTKAVNALRAVGITDPSDDEIMEYYNGSLEGQVAP